MIENLTASFVESARPGKGRVEYWDKELPGFGLRVTKTGVKTFCAVYRVGGIKRRLTLGKYPTVTLKAARKAAKRALGAAQNGKDVAAEKQADRAGLTFGALADDYIEGHAKVHKRQSSIYADTCMINSDLAALKNRKAADITNADVSLILRVIVKRGRPIKANRVLALLSKIFRYGIGTGILARGSVSPTYLVPRPGDESDRDRVLTDAEIKKVWLALDAQPTKAAAFIKLGLLTAQRAREVLGMAKAEVDFEKATWLIPGARTKNGREHLVPLSTQAMDIIESLKNDSPYFFPSRRVAVGALNSYKKWIDQIRIATGTTDATKPGYFTVHDLRRTVATEMARLPEPKITRFMIDRVLNHTDPGVGAKYDRYEYESEKRAALTRWAARLSEIVAGKGSSSSIKQPPRAATGVAIRNGRHD